VFAVLLLAGCGGGGGGTKERVIQGLGYTFAAPAEWKASRTARETRLASGLNVVSVTRFELARAFRPELWPQVVKELDRAAEAVAARQRGEVVDPQTSTIAGLRARRYDISYERDGKELVERIAFVLQGKTEYLLLCRYEAGGETRACDRLLATFKLT
jgi:plasmid stabilization system protein ParE